MAFAYAATGLCAAAYAWSVLRVGFGTASQSAVTPSPALRWLIGGLLTYPAVALASAASLGSAAVRQAPVSWAVFWAPVFYLAAFCPGLVVAAQVPPVQSGGAPSGGAPADRLLAPDMGLLCILLLLFVVGALVGIVASNTVLPPLTPRTPRP